MFPYVFGYKHKTFEILLTLQNVLCSTKNFILYTLLLNISALFHILELKDASDCLMLLWFAGRKTLSSLQIMVDRVIVRIRPCELLAIS